jgi:hypothetical protein
MALYGRKKGAAVPEKRKEKEEKYSLMRNKNNGFICQAKESVTYEY